MIIYCCVTKCFSYRAEDVFLTFKGIRDDDIITLCNYIVDINLSTTRVRL